MFAPNYPYICIASFVIVESCKIWLAVWEACIRPSILVYLLLVQGSFHQQYGSKGVALGQNYLVDMMQDAKRTYRPLLKAPTRRKEFHDEVTNGSKICSLYAQDARMH